MQAVYNDRTEHQSSTNRAMNVLQANFLSLGALLKERTNTSHIYVKQETGRINNQYVSWKPQ